MQSLYKTLILVAIIISVFTGCIKGNKNSSPTPEPSPTTGLGKIEGKILNSKTREPVEGATVELGKTKITSISDKEGNYSLENFPGSFTLLARKDGYRENTRTREISAGDTLKENILLIPLMEDTPVPEIIPTKKPTQNRKPVMVVTNYYSNEVVSVDPEKNKILNKISAGKEPEGIDGYADGGLVYVANSGDDTITLLEASPQTLIPRGHITVNKQPKALVTTKNCIYVVNSGDNNISVIDRIQNKEIKTIQAGKMPTGIIKDSNEQFIYVLNSRSDNISVIDTGFNTLVKNIGAGKFPCSGTISPSGTELYVVNQVSKDLSVIDLEKEKILINIPVGNIPKDCLLVPDSNKIYVTNYQDNTISVIDCFTQKNIKTIETGENPLGLAFLKSRNRLYVANGGSNTLSIIDVLTDQIAGKISGFNFPYDILILQE